MTGMEQLKRRLDWCKNYMDTFNKNEQFDPYASLTDSETPQQKLYGACCIFVYDVQENIERLCKEFDDKRNQIIFGG